MADPNFWSNKDLAQEKVRELNDLKAELAGAGKFEAGDAIVNILSGAGGDDAEDFSRLLFEMYMKWADSKKFTLSILHQNENDHGGYRNLTFQVSHSASQAAGLGPYGLLKNESGVHRLVRKSPFNAKGLRHTSFSLVEVLPVFPKAEVHLPEDELKIEFARSSGPGGQNVNKRETAVRIVHLPTGLSAHCDSERSQVANKEKTLAILQAKLHKLREEERMKKEQGLYVSKTTEIEWGSQIRSYVMHPYQLVKDHRTGHESTDIDGVLAGDIDSFLEAEKEL